MAKSKAADMQHDKGHPAMKTPPIVSAKDWEAAREGMLGKEKALMRARDALVVYERWRSLEDLELHLRTSYIAALRAEIDAAMEGQPSFQLLLPA